MAVAYGSAHTGTATAASTCDVTGVTGGTDQAYALAVSRRLGSAVSSVVGGGLTWTNRDSQSSGRGQIHTEVWTAYGTPSSDPFTITVTMGSSTDTITANVVRMTGADSGTTLTTVRSQNTNGLNGAATGGTDNASPTIPQNVAVNDTLVINFCALRTGYTGGGTDADYTVCATADATGGTRVNNRSYRRLVTAGAPISPDTITHGADANTDWVMMSLAVESAVAGAQTLTPNGLALTLSLGAPTITAATPQTLAPNGLALTLALGAPTIAAATPQALVPAGLGLTLALGLPTIANDTPAPDPPPAPTAVRTRALWVFEAIAHDGTPLAELPMRGRSVTLARNAGGAARGSLGLLEAGAGPLADALRLGQVDLRVSRDERRVWQGSLEAAQGQLDALTGRVEFAGVSLWEILGARFVPLGLEITATEATQMAWQLIEDTQALTFGDLGIVAGDLPDSVARTRRWDTPTSVAAAVQELAELADGFDWSLSPQQAGEGDGLRWDAWWPRQGTDAGIVLEWGRNVAGVGFQASAAAVRNRATARTSNQIGVSAEDLTSQGLHRLREAEISAGDIDDAGVLADRAAGELRPSVRILPRLTCIAGAVSLDDIGIGDTVEVHVRHGWLQLAGTQRVEQIEVAISDEGDEQLTITVQEEAA